jgi:hypothetical protein
VPVVMSEAMAGFVYKKTNEALRLLFEEASA